MAGDAPPFKHLIVVPCHGIYKGAGEPHQDASWYLKEFQRGEGCLLSEHVRSAVLLASLDDSTILVFSGGQTNRHAGPISEAQSYWYLAEECQWWEMHSMRDRAITEEYARDSYENLLYSICRFRQFTGCYPITITIAGWSFKEARFRGYCRDLRYPTEQFVYKGINNPADFAAAQEGESEALTIERNASRDKRQARNPFRRSHPYSSCCPELRQVLDGESSRQNADVPLPW